MVTASILGASGYTGGELLRLLLQHRDVQVVGATSQRFAGEFLHKAHPNLRGRTQLKFVNRNELPTADIVFTCVPHGQGMKAVPALLEQGCRVIDLSADYRLRDAATFKQWYGEGHTSPDLLKKAVYGLPEFHREEIKGARLVSGVGCTATSINLALYPLVKASLLTKGPVVADIKIGSSASGLEANIASIHAERSGAVRLYAPTSHRHVAEVQQELRLNGSFPTIHYSAHAIERVRGILATCHVFLARDDVEPVEIWKAYRTAYGNEPFVRIVKERSGIHRFPDPKLVAGSNYADIGFELEEGTNRLVAVCAIDNLVKGAAGSAVQCMNLMFGLDETTGLTQLPLHPV
jgi:N-acetyl-gamma-glutamyl-phosphate/LysW-gamma-L-alpha-aminoadipyl-6-phosphate reductase